MINSNVSGEVLKYLQSKLSDLYIEILSKEKQIQEIMEQNNKQKEQLELISHEIDLKLKKLSSFRNNSISNLFLFLLSQDFILLAIEFSRNVIVLYIIQLLDFLFSLL